jgi:integrase
MGRTAKPWWWPERNGYYAFVRGSRLRLGDTKKEAEDALKALLKAAPGKVSGAASVEVLLDAFLDWTLANRSKKTYEGYRDFCQSFKDKWPDLLLDDLRPRHVTEWLAERKTWNSTTRRGAITCLQRVMNWGEENWDLEKNPLRKLAKPEAKRREQIISPAEFEKILAAIPDTEFKELLIVSAEVGCRPVEVKRLEARHVDLKNHIWFIPKEEAKGGRKPRTVYMTSAALKIIKRLVGEHPKGKLFLNARGRPWTASAVKCRFARLEEKLGTRYCQTLLRHTWITKKIIAGVDSHVVAALAGHSDSSMIDRVYSKVAADHKFMLEAARTESKTKRKTK